MNGALEALAAAFARAQPCVLVTVAATRGSTPRAAGTAMLVTPAGTAATIGGGNLEYRAIEMARAMLATPAEAAVALHRFPLGPSLGQCCGGVAEVLFETIAAGRSRRPDWLTELLRQYDAGNPVTLVSLISTAGAPAKLLVGDDLVAGTLGAAALDDAAITLVRERRPGGAPGHRRDRSGPPPCGLRHVEVGAVTHHLLVEDVGPPPLDVVLFGAGHVGRAVAAVLGELPCRLTWVDERADAFPATVPANARTRISRLPEAEVGQARPGSYFLVMTHSHPLDQRLCEAVLRRGDFAYLGLIGSATKRRRFAQRLAAAGVGAAAIERLVCPIGAGGPAGKHPGEIAVAVAGELLARDGAVQQDRDRAVSVSSEPPGTAPAAAGEGCTEPSASAHG